MICAHTLHHLSKSPHFADLVLLKRWSSSHEIQDAGFPAAQTQISNFICAPNTRLGSRIFSSSTTPITAIVMSPGSARSGSPISTSSSVGGDSINKELESVANLARADADLIPKPFDLNEDVRLDDEDDADQVSQLRPPTTMINDRSISYGEGISPEVYLLQNQLSRLHMERADSHQFAHRTYSAPVASQLGHLQNPNLSNYTHTSDDASDLHPSALQKQASQELADLVQLPIQTIIQLSPPHLLDHAKEQYAACGLTFPTPSISSFLTVSKALNYLSIFLSSPHKTKRTDAPAFNLSWDIGEMLQGVADGLAGLAAERSVNNVIAHSGANLQHVSVKGSSPVINEGSLSFGLLHVSKIVAKGSH